MEADMVDHVVEALTRDSLNWQWVPPEPCADFC